VTLVEITLEKEVSLVNVTLVVQEVKKYLTLKK